MLRNPHASKFSLGLATVREQFRWTANATQDVSPELRALFVASGKANLLATCDAKIAELRAALPYLADMMAALEGRACYRCNGTGTYHGRTNATRRGHAYCFACNGTGEQ